MCTIPLLLLAFEAEQNGRTTLKISFVMSWLLCVQFKMNLQIIILPKPLLHAWHLRDAKSVHGGWLVVLRLNVPVNNFSVMLGRSHRFLGN